MKLIYAYIKQFRNIVNQEIQFCQQYLVSYNPTLPFLDGLRIYIKEPNETEKIVFKDNRLSDIHLLVGKTGAGKTNILQMLGMKEEERYEEKEIVNSYFLLYKTNTGFMIEPFNIDISNAIKCDSLKDKFFDEYPESLKVYIRLYESMQIYCFQVNEDGVPINIIPKSLEDIKKEGDYTYFFNGYDKNSLLYYPYDEHMTEMETNRMWLPRENAEYHKTALWCSCRFLKEYIETFSTDNIKRKASFIIQSSNWADTIKQHLGENLQKREYWTFAERKREAENSAFRKKQVKEVAKPSIKQQFVHDLWTDFAKYLRKWISYIEMFSNDTKDENSSDIEPESEYWDYYFEKELDEEEKLRGKKKYKDKVRIDPTILPDGEDMSILKRIEWLSMYIDRKDGYARGLLWQIYTDIRDIGNILLNFDDKYFTTTTFTIPIEEIYTERNKFLIYDLFERMEQYRPDQVGIFTKELLPYRFDCISSGEYQLAKVLGGIEEYCVKLSVGNYGNRPNIIYLLDEPDTYMHPELCRIFLSNLSKILKERNSTTDIQVLISTHSPLLLSDVFPWQVTRLDLDDKGYCIIKNGMDKACFGANIHSILADGFFLQYTIGEFARNYLQKEINFLIDMEGNLEKTKKEKRRINDIKTVVPHIGDRIIKRYLENMLKNLGEDV